MLVELPVSELWEVDGTESVLTLGAIFATLEWGGGRLLRPDDGERLTKGHNEGAIL